MIQAWMLDLLNFALAGAREGFGPFLGVFLQSRNFDPASTGLAMSVAGIAGMLATGPLGALIDATRAKRAAMVVAVAVIAVGAVLIVATDKLWLVGVGQVLIGVADASLAPLVAALTLGLVGRQAYVGRVSRNEAFNHAGNAANAAFAALLGYWLGLGWVAAGIVVMAIATSVVVLRINPKTIDHREAAGGEASDPAWKVLGASKPLLLLAGVVFVFETANGAMLPFLAQALTAAGRDPSLTTGAMTVVAQIAMIGASLVAPRLGVRFGRRAVLGAALATVVLRAGLAAFSGALPVIAAIQLLEGLSMGLAGVAIPALVVGMMAGTGHAGAGLGAVMTAFGAGAALSPIVAGSVAQFAGFPAAFLTLGVMALGGLAIWVTGTTLEGRAARHAGVPPLL